MLNIKNIGMQASLFGMTTLCVGTLLIGCSSSTEDQVAPPELASVDTPLEGVPDIRVAAEALPEQRNGMTVGRTFNTGVGIGIDSGRSFDNQKAQVFIPRHAGMLHAVELTLSRMDGTTAPLVVQVARYDGSSFSEPLDTAEIGPNAMAFGTGLKDLTPNTKLTFLNGATLEAGEMYALIIRTREPEANYRVYGVDDRASPTTYPHEKVQRLSRQNGSPWEGSSVTTSLIYRVHVDVSNPGKSIKEW
ncbi:MAG: hypothetical protein AAF561_07230 [Planctomycetota bacterium]